jgi:Na+-translocating ferredoxin:NAD+ oxidoreductase RnfD subunit
MISQTLPHPLQTVFQILSFKRGLFKDPRITVALLLFTYLCLGFTVLGFNRSPAQVALTSLIACSLELFFMKIIRKRVEFPLSALITSFGLSLLLNYSHGFWLVFFPVFFAIGSKYIFTLEGKHVFNPAQIAVVFSLFFSGDLITAAPAYQWNGLEAMALFIALPAIFFALPGVGKLPIILSFMITFTLQTALRAFIMKHHLPFETLFLGTLTSPAFFLFVFFMITDPATSPKTVKLQILAGVCIALLDLIFHLFQSYYTFFYAGFTYALIRFSVGHCKRIFNLGFKSSFQNYKSYLHGAATVSFVGLVYLVGFTALSGFIAKSRDPGFKFVSLPSSRTGISTQTGDLFHRVDPAVQHVIKWLFSVGASVASGDLNNDGIPDLVFTAPLMQDHQRIEVYLGAKNFEFKKLDLPALDALGSVPEIHGIATQALVVDYDNDHDLDIYLSAAFGSPKLFKNLLNETGQLSFEDVTEQAGLNIYSISVSSTFFDFNNDGYLDLFVANVLPENLPDYETPTRLNFFNLPKPAFDGDDRPYHFMHQSWNNSRNGGKNRLLLGTPEGRFVPLDSDAIGIPETGWSLSVGSVDLNRDGFADIYVANDFGPDDLYLNDHGKSFKPVRGSLFGSIGKDTYKGMNVSIDDLDGNGWQDVYVSNVHHSMQAEGSLLWMFSPPEVEAPLPVPTISDKATFLGALNPSRFGWGAAIGDFNNDGLLDLAQANGMVDDTIDKTFSSCPDYWYTNEKLARSPPSIHGYANKWGDIRGYCIFGKEKNRVYMNRGAQERPQFVDAAVDVV